MAKQYRIIVYKNHHKWCCIDVENPWAEEVLNDIQEILRSEIGYKLEILEATGERRICVIEPEGIKLLSREVLFKPATKAT
jgi:hypothetical protein